MQKEILTMLGGLLSSAASRGDKGAIENRTVQVGAENYDYQIFVPPHVETQKNLPVIIFLHGIGQRGAGGFVPASGAGGAIASHYLSQVPAIVLLPQCRAGVYWSDDSMDKMVSGALDKTIEEFGADAKRIYLTGVSMGGYGVWHFAQHYPQKFAALVSLCGGSSITNGDRFSPVAAAVGKTPAWIFHGADDRIVPVAESRQIVKALEAVDGNVKYSEYAGVGHNVWMNALGEKDLLPWLLAQRLD